MTGTDEDRSSRADRSPPADGPSFGDRSSSSDRERGAATVVSAVISIVLVVLGGVGCNLGAVVIARTRAEGAADLAALAAAGHSADGQGRACQNAGWVVRTMRTRMISCHVRGSEARVEVRGDSVRGASGLGIPASDAEIRAHARAAQVSEVPDSS